jgi:hypothetical protein
LEFESSCKQTLNTHTCKLHVAVLLLASVAVQVTVVQPTGNVDPDGGLHTAVTPGQLSVAVGLGYVTTAPEPPITGVTEVTLAGQMITGGCVSFTCTTKLHIALGGTPFVAVQVTVVEPTLNVAGDVTTAIVSDLIHVTVGDGIPVAVTVNDTDAEH